MGREKHIFRSEYVQFLYAQKSRKIASRTYMTFQHNKFFSSEKKQKYREMIKVSFNKEKKRNLAINLKTKYIKFRRQLPTVLGLNLKGVKGFHPEFSWICGVVLKNEIYVSIKQAFKSHKPQKSQPHIRFRKDIQIKFL